jgi:hypothetical protein
MTVNVTIALADRYAAVRAARDAAQKELDALSKEIKALGQETLHGVTCDLHLCLSEQQRVDQSLIDPAILDAARRPVLVETIRVKAKGIQG